LFAKSVIKSLRSSPAALEAVLQRLVTAGGESHNEIDATLDDVDGVGEDDPNKIDGALDEQVSGVLRRAMHEIAALRVDSKVNSLGDLISNLSIPQIPDMRICVLTDSLATCYYLAAEIEGRGISYQLLHSGMDPEERRTSLRRFLASQGILIATGASMTSGIDLSTATDLVLYEIPVSRSAIDRVLGRFDRIGRQTQLSVHVFVPSNGEAADSAELEILRQAIAGRAGDQPEFGSLLSD
jgi:superfamily II DNA/RNA helicase